MEIVGSILKSLPLATGTSPKGDWKRRPILVQTQGDYPKTVLIDVYNGRIDQLKGLSKGDLVRITAEASSKDIGKNGRLDYRTSITALSIDALGEPAVGRPKAMPTRQQTHVAYDTLEAAGSDEPTIAQSISAKWDCLVYSAIDQLDAHLSTVTTDLPGRCDLLNRLRTSFINKQKRIQDGHETHPMWDTARDNEGKPYGFAKAYSRLNKTAERIGLDKYSYGYRKRLEQFGEPM